MDGNNLTDDREDIRLCRILYEMRAGAIRHALRELRSVMNSHRGQALSWPARHDLIMAQEEIAEMLAEDDLR